MEWIFDRRPTEREISQNYNSAIKAAEFITMTEGSNVPVAMMYDGDNWYRNDFTVGSVRCWTIMPRI